MELSQHKEDLTSLNPLFYPQSVAIIGASDDPSKSGYQITRNLLDLGYVGSIYAINPKKDEVLGLKCYSNLLAIPERVELIIISIPAFGVPDVLRQAATRKDVRAAVIIASGFSETKIPERIQLEKEIVEIAQQANIRLMGPNCVGVMNTENHLDTTFAAGIKQVRGGMSVISQSGALGASLLMLASSQPVPMGFNKWAHVGNQCDVSVLEILRYYGDDPGTHVVSMYMEGVNNGREFLNVAGEVAQEKPVVILKVGRSETGSWAAASHTGSLAGSDEIYTAAFNQAGILRVNNLEELLDTSKAFAMQPLPKGNRIAVLTEAGGPGIIAVDELGFAPYVQMPDFSPETKEKLKKILPPMALVDHVKGYVDMSAAAMEEHHGQALAAVLDDPNVDGVVFLSVPPTFLRPTALAEEVIKVCRSRSNKPVTVCLIGGEFVREASQFLELEGIPTYDVPDRAARAMTRMVQRALYLRKLEVSKEATEDDIKAPAGERGRLVIAEALATGRNLLEPEACQLLSDYGINTTPSYLVKTVEEGLEAANKLGYPVVLKVVSTDILHKSDAGAVKININNMEELRAAYQEILANVRSYKSDASIKGILVCTMAKPGVECIIGAKRDGQFGPVVMFGLGGIFVEVYKDVTFRVAPVSLAEAREMVQSIKGFPLLNGARGRQVCDTESLAQMIVNIGKLMEECPEVSEIDLNPVAVYEQGKGALALDARVILAQPELKDVTK